MGTSTHIFTTRSYHVHAPWWLKLPFLKGLQEKKLSNLSPSLQKLRSYSSSSYEFISNQRCLELSKAPHSSLTQIKITSFFKPSLTGVPPTHTALDSTSATNRGNSLQKATEIRWARRLCLVGHCPHAIMWLLGCWRKCDHVQFQEAHTKCNFLNSSDTYFIIWGSHLGTKPSHVGRP